MVSGGVDDCFPAADCSPRTFPRPDVVSPPSSPSIPSDHTSATHTYRAHSSVYSSPGAETTIAGARGYRRRMDLIASTATPGSPRTACT